MTWLVVRARARRTTTGSGSSPELVLGHRAAEQAAAGVPRGRPRGGRPRLRPARGCCAARTSGPASAIALALWSPWIAWQASHGWPQLDVSREIAAGGSTSSEPWWAVVPFQLLLVSPPLAPVWIAGLVALFRDPALRDVRFLAWAWVVLAVVFMATAGKPYYLAGLLPVLVAAGAMKVDGWLDRGAAGAAPRARSPSRSARAPRSAMVIALPVLPARNLDPVLALNEDVGETIGWPELARTVAHVVDELPGARRAVILTQQLRPGRSDRPLRPGARAPAPPTAATTPTATGARRPTAPRRSSRSACIRPTSRTCAAAASPRGSPTTTTSTTRSAAPPSWSAPARAARGRGSGRRCATSAAAALPGRAYRRSKRAKPCGSASESGRRRAGEVVLLVREDVAPAARGDLDRRAELGLAQRDDDEDLAVLAAGERARRRGRRRAACRRPRTARGGGRAAPARAR